jgi:hypothetical protein
MISMNLQKKKKKKRETLIEQLVNKLKFVQKINELKLNRLSSSMINSS